VWKQYVPPVFYIGTTALLSKQSIYSIQMPFLAASLLAFYALNLLWVRISDSDSDSSTHKAGEGEGGEVGSPAPQCDASGGSSPSTGLEHYKLYTAPPGSEARQWVRQLGYDLACYILPLTAVPLALPRLQVPCSIFCVAVLTLARPLYEVVAKAIFLQDSPIENAEKALRRQKSYPKGSEFPTGWFRIMNSDQLPKLGVKYVQAMGKDLAVFRGEDGIARCIDAYCIHLGSNMAIGGKVKNNCLQCPFHLWSFDGSGRCTEIPYSPKVPAQAKTRAYHVAEWYGILSVWFTNDQDQDQDPEARPEYYPPNLAGIDDGSMVLRGKTQLKVNMHLQEFAENSTDFAHFGPLHGTMGFPFTGIELPMKMVTINHLPDWKEGTGDEAHMAWFLNKADLNIFGRHSPESGAMAVISFVGPGGLVFFSFDTPIGRLVLMQTNTPLEAMRMEVAFR
jgi:cholesterol 7-desaturase